MYPPETIAVVPKPSHIKSLWRVPGLQMTDTPSAAFFTLPVLTKQVCFLFYNNFCLILQDCK